VHEPTHVPKLCKDAAAPFGKAPVIKTTGVLKTQSSWICPQRSGWHFGAESTLFWRAGKRLYKLERRTQQAWIVARKGLLPWEAFQMGADFPHGRVERLSV
jgi:hypothetical protein